MSERDERSFSNRSLLMEASLSDATPGAEREALADYKKICSQSIEANEKLIELNAMLREMASAGESGTEKFTSCRTAAKKCVDIIHELDNLALHMENSILQSLIKRLLNRAYAEENRLGELALENNYRESVARQEQVIQEWGVNRGQALANRKKNIMAKDLLNYYDRENERREERMEEFFEKLKAILTLIIVVVIIVLVAIYC